MVISPHRAGTQQNNFATRKKKNSIKLGEDTQKKKLRDQEKIKNFYIM